MRWCEKRVSYACLLHAEINRDMITLLGAAWTCEDSYDPSDPTSRLPLPYFHEAILHPCSKLDGGLSCCGANSSYAPAHLLYRSWFNIPNILLLLTYEVNPRCGDGLTFESKLIQTISEWTLRVFFEVQS